MISYFKKEYNIDKIGDILWSHAVNSREKLSRYINNPLAMILESDIRIFSEGEIICAHPPQTDSDLTAEELIRKLKSSRQGLKLDLKDPEVVIPILKILDEIKLSQPVIINGDILQGNGASSSKFSPKDFIALCRKFYPDGILSLGWTTVSDPNLPYTFDNVSEMLKLCNGLSKVIFSIRACLLLASWQALKPLMEKKDFTLSIWNNEPIDTELKNWIKNNTDSKRTFYDFINEDKDPLRLW